MSCYMSLAKKQKCHVTSLWEKNKSVISCVALEEKEKHGVTWVWEKKSVISCTGLEGKKSVLLHGFGRKTKVSRYIALEEKQKCHVTWF